MTDLYQYPWDEAPPEAMWAATDETGGAYWYIDKPQIGDTVWHWTGKRKPYLPIRGWFPEHLWEESLRHRPLFGYIEPRIDDLMKSMRVSLDYWNLEPGAWMVIGEYMMQAAYRGAVATQDYNYDSVVEKTKGENDEKRGTVMSKKIAGVFEVELVTTVHVTIYEDPMLLEDFARLIAPNCTLSDIAGHIAHNTHRLGSSFVEGVGEEGYRFDVDELETEDSVEKIT